MKRMPSQKEKLLRSDSSSRKKINFEKFAWQELDPELPLIGVDEVGRGCLAGPVYAGAVYINGDNPWAHYTDSKKLSALRREKLSEQIHRDHFVGIGFADVEEIARLNILQASLLAMQRAVLRLMEKMKVTQAHLLIDGSQVIPGFCDFSGRPGKEKWLLKQTTLVKGDLRAEPVAAASIVAKVERDRVITDLAQQYPGYGLEVHKGYATSVHRQAIERLGPCPVHRRTFAGVREFWPS